MPFDGSPCSPLTPPITAGSVKGYAMIDFQSESNCKKVLLAFNGNRIPGTRSVRAPLLPLELLMAQHVFTGSTTHRPVTDEPPWRAAAAAPPPPPPRLTPRPPLAAPQLLLPAGVGH